MLLTLEKILSIVAKDKKISKAKEWVEQKLNHCEVESDYYNYIHLKSNKRMWFGIRDAEFDCKPFILYRECENTESTTIKEFEIYTFKTLEDKNFKLLVQESYQYGFDFIKDFRLYFNSHPIMFKVCGSKGEAILQEYNDLDMGFEVWVSLYHLMDVSKTLNVFFNNQDALCFALQQSLGFMKVDTLRSDDYTTIFLPHHLRLTYMGKPLDFSVRKIGTEIQIQWAAPPPLD